MAVAPVIPDMETLVGSTIARILADKRYRMGHNYLWSSQGDAANTVLAAAGYDFRRLIRWLSLLLRKILSALTAAVQTVLARSRSSSRTTR
jgi:hypothetical protein